VSGSGGCNRFTGSYELNGERLTFGETAGTMMGCIEGMETEKEFFAALKQVRRGKVSSQQLQLLDAEDKPVARFEAVYMK
jgi:heat shock protein HslJ